MKPRLYKLLEHAVEQGVGWGLHRAYKHTDDPTREQIETQVAEHVMNELCEWFDFDSEVRINVGEGFVGMPERLGAEIARRLNARD